MAEAGEERTEEATQTRREEFRSKGQVAQTRELSTAVVLMVFALCIYGLSQFFIKEMFELFQESFGAGLVASVRQGDMVRIAWIAGEKLSIMLLPILGVALLVTVGSSVAQVGLLQVEDAISPNFERIDPLQGLQKLVSLRNFVEGLKSLIKIIIIGYIGYLVLKSEFQVVPMLSEAGVSDIASFMGRLAAKLFGFVGFAILCLALADYLFQRWELERRMMMTKQEVREENKSREGDPMIKARIRKIQRDVANRRMMTKVPTADVIITNPTHIAVALKYDATLPAPQVIAKGADLIAEKIKEIAKSHSIPVVENKPLARTIFKTIKIGQIIPRELYVAVAEVLSYVYKLKRRFSGSSTSSKRGDRS